MSEVNDTLKGSPLVTTPRVFQQEIVDAGLIFMYLIVSLHQNKKMSASTSE